MIRKTAAVLILFPLIIVLSPVAVLVVVGFVFSSLFAWACQELSL